MSDTRQHVHELVDQLDAGQLDAVGRLLEVMVAPSDAAPDEDGDILSEAERKAIGEADEWLKSNQPVPHEEVLAELGLTIDDWEKMTKEPEAALRTKT
jgi:hypothetical protein